MRKKRSILMLIIVCYVLSIATICFAEIYSQKDGLFKISVPEGWSVVDNPRGVNIMNPKEDSGIIIQFKPMVVESEENRKERLKVGNQIVIKHIVEPNKGTVLSEGERSIDGVYARQLNFLLTVKGEAGHMTYISFFNKDYVFTITFGSPLKEERLKMEEIVETFQF